MKSEIRYDRVTHSYAPTAIDATRKNCACALAWRTISEDKLRRVLADSTKGRKNPVSRRMREKNIQYVEACGQSDTTESTRCRWCL
jgi:hypothetical protein